MSTNYQKGYRKEKLAREFLEGMGYFVVESRGSRGPIDLIAIPTRCVAAATDGLIRLVQVKSGKPISKAERGRLKQLAAKLDNKRILIEVWSFPPWQTKPLLESIP